MRFVVTGAGSFLGSAVVKRLKEEGHKVTEFKHSYEEDEDDLPHRADAWIHFAWAGAGSAGRQDDEIQGYNIGMSMAALEKAIELNCRKFIFAGSQAEYGRAQDGSLKNEDGPAEPVSPYGDAKLLFSKLARTRIDAYNREENCPRPMRYVHMRFFSVYGPGDHKTSLISTLIDKLSKGERVELGPCDQKWNYLYIDDAAEGVMTLCTKFTGDTYNIGSDDIRPLKEYVLETAEVIEKYLADSKATSSEKTQNCDASNIEEGQSNDKLRKLLCFGERDNNAEGSADLSPDNSKMKALGFEAKVSFREGIKRVLMSEHLKANGDNQHQ